MSRESSNLQPNRKETRQVLWAIRVALTARQDRNSRNGEVERMANEEERDIGELDAAEV
jgi:hypothetical protein